MPTTNKSSPRRRRVTTSADWKRDLIGVFRVIIVRFIDRGHPTRALVALALGVLLVVLVRMPEDALGKLPALVAWLFTNDRFVVIALATCAAFLAWACVLLMMTLLLMRRTYRSEIERVAAYKKTLEEAMAPGRPRTNSAVPANGAVETLKLVSMEREETELDEDTEEFLERTERRRVRWR